jgi:hypothetical protein
MRDGGDGKRECARRDALAAARFMLRVWAATYVVAKVVCHFVPTAYVEATFRDALCFELGLVIATVVVLVRAWL